MTRPQVRAKDLTLNLIDTLLHQKTGKTSENRPIHQTMSPGFSASRKNDLSGCLTKEKVQAGCPSTYWDRCGVALTGLGGFNQEIL
jgi:hypothetical protein